MSAAEFLLTQFPLKYLDLILMEHMLKSKNIERNFINLVRKKYKLLSKRSLKRLISKIFLLNTQQKKNPLRLEYLLLSTDPTNTNQTNG